MGWYIAVSVCAFFAMRSLRFDAEESFIFAVVWGPAVVLSVIWLLLLWSIIAKHEEEEG